MNSEYCAPYLENVNSNPAYTSRASSSMKWETEYYWYIDGERQETPDDFGDLLDTLRRVYGEVGKITLTTRSIYWFDHPDWRVGKLLYQKQWDYNDEVHKAVLRGRWNISVVPDTQVSPILRHVYAPDEVPCIQDLQNGWVYYAVYDDELVSGLL